MCPVNRHPIKTKVALIEFVTYNLVMTMLVVSNFVLIKFIITELVIIKLLLKEFFIAQFLKNNFVITKFDCTVYVRNVRKNKTMIKNINEVHFISTTKFI
jgi:hypothetical protein